MQPPFPESLPQWRAAEELEAALGDPFDARTPFSLERAVALDEPEEFPEELLAAAGGAGYLEKLVPAEHGGALASIEEALALQRAVSRRDLTTAIALGQSFLGAAAVWLAGSPEQRQSTSALLRSGSAAALALTEEAHGADVLAGDVRADPLANGSVSLTGTKWLINNGTRARLLAVLAREGDAAGLGGFSLFLVDKAALVAGACRPLPKKRTLGIRGADISGVELRSAALPATARIGPMGSGAELLLHSLQITRIGCCGFSLGAADTALRIATDFALSRKLYGARVWDIPHARDSLASAFADLLAADCVATAAARAVHAAPEQLSLISAIAKAFVPSRVDVALRELAVVLGARHYLREGLGAGAFQKILRDAAVVSLFDGSLPINLDGIGTQLFRLSSRQAADPAERERTLQSMFDLVEILPSMDATRLRLLNGGRDDVTQGLPELVARLEQDTGLAASPWRDEVLGHLRNAERLLGENAAALAELSSRDRAGLKRSAELFELANRHCALFAVAACAQLFARSAPLLGSYFMEAGWLALAIDRLLAGFAPRAVPSRHPALDGAAAELLCRHAADRSFGIAPIRLAPRTAKPKDHRGGAEKGS